MRFHSVLVASLLTEWDVQGSASTQLLGPGPCISAEPAASRQRGEGEGTELTHAVALLKEGNNQPLTLTSCHKSFCKLKMC